MNGELTVVLLLYHQLPHMAQSTTLLILWTQVQVFTQNIESYWNEAKMKLKRMKGCHAEQLPSYLDEFMWRERFGTTSRNAWFNIIQDIAQQYPV